MCYYWRSKKRTFSLLFENKKENVRFLMQMFLYGNYKKTLRHEYVHSKAHVREKKDIKSEVKPMPQVQEFYDVKTKKKFKTDKYKLVTKAGRNFIVAKSESGPHECWRVVSKETAAKLK